MERKRIFWIALDSVFVIVFLVFFFTLSGPDNNTAVWIAFSGILFSYASILFTPLMVRKSNASTDYRRPLFVATLSYFNISFIIGLIIMIVRPEHYKATLLTYVALFGVFAIFLLLFLLSNEHTAEQEAKKAEELKYVKEAAARLKLLQENIKDKTLSKKINDAYDLISSSPVNSNSSVKAFENSILQEISDVENLDPITDSVAIMQSIELIISLANKRNSKLRAEN
jgi:Na+/melibiose symporter-like transporter